jgi:hypothetical protein
MHAKRLHLHALGNLGTLFSKLNEFPSEMIPSKAKYSVIKSYKLSKRIRILNSPFSYNSANVYSFLGGKRVTNFFKYPEGCP